MRTDGRTDRHTKRIVDFRNFSNAHKNVCHRCLCFVKVGGISGYCGGARVIPHGFIVMKISLILCMLCFVTFTVVH